MIILYKSVCNVDVSSCNEYDRSSLDANPQCKHCCVARPPRRENDAVDNHELNDLHNAFICTPLKVWMFFRDAACDKRC